MQHQQQTQPTLSEQVTSFTHELFGELRTLTDQEGNPWFVAKDIGRALGYVYPEQLARYLDDEDRGVADITTRTGIQTLNTFSESGLYAAILRSRKPEAKVFKRWVTSEVLPSIRKHGGYTIGQEDISPEELAIRAMPALRSKLEEKEQQLKAQQPKVDFVDNYMDSRGTECLQALQTSCSFFIQINAHYPLAALITVSLDSAQSWIDTKTQPLLKVYL